MVNSQGQRSLAETTAETIAVMIAVMIAETLMTDANIHLDGRMTDTPLVTAIEVVDNHTETIETEATIVLQRATVTMEEMAIVVEEEDTHKMIADQMMIEEGTQIDHEILMTEINHEVVTGLLLEAVTDLHHEVVTGLPRVTTDHLLEAVLMLEDFLKGLILLLAAKNAILKFVSRRDGYREGGSYPPERNEPDRRDAGPVGGYRDGGRGGSGGYRRDQYDDRGYSGAGRNDRR